MCPKLGSIVGATLSRLPLSARGFDAFEVPIIYRPTYAPWLNWTITIVVDPNTDNIVSAVIYNGEVARAQFNTVGKRSWKLDWFDFPSSDQRYPSPGSEVVRYAAKKFAEIVGDEARVNYYIPA